MRQFLPAAACVAALALSAIAAAQESEAPQPVTGRATALSSDVISLDGRTFRFAGADGIALHQTCYVDGRPWSCGASALRGLQTIVDPAAVTCEPVAAVPADPPLAQCFVGGADIAALMVRDGLALNAEGGPYEAQQQQARDARVGVWQGDFLPPPDYRADLAAIEAAYRQRALETLRDSAERELVGRNGVAIDIFENFEIAEDGPADVPRREVRVAGLEPGFIENAASGQDVFSWQAVAVRLRQWQQAVLGAIRFDIRDLAFDELARRPSSSVQTNEMYAYLSAIKTNSAAWIAAKRQPILLVASPQVPTWLRLWFSGEPPPFTNVEFNPLIVHSGYLGTVEGVEVYVGPVPPTASALFPADLLARVVYSPDPQGTTLAARTEDGGANVVASYAVSFEWRDDEIVWLTFPESEAESLYDR